MILRAIALFDRSVEVLACTILIALLCCVTLGVITRSLGDPLIWTDEISRFLMIWLAVFGWILATRRRTHVRIRFFQDLLPKPAWAVAEFLIQVALLVFGLCTAVYGVSLTLRNLDLEATTVPISFAWMYAPMVIAGAVTTAQATAELCNISGRKPAASPLNESTVE